MREHRHEKYFRRIGMVNTFVRTIRTHRRNKLDRAEMTG